MIKTLDLIDWAKEHASRKSIQYPHGFITGEELKSLADCVLRSEPIDFIPIRNTEDKDA